ncbi:hypothetical protein GLYMA_13G056033v4 [Glycine max]|nr:hypothetical protein GLYMA_13G056033v4 [Glycine max]KAH1099999.1 hypothetical protein GYH30_035245 [Glycine max]
MCPSLCVCLYITLSGLVQVAAEGVFLHARIYNNTGSGDSLRNISNS